MDTVRDSETMGRWKEAYDRDGYVVIRQFLSGSAFARLQLDLERYIREVVPSLPDGDAFYEDRSNPQTLKQLNRLQGDETLAEYLRHPAWNDLARCLLGEACQAEGMEWFNKPPGTNHATPPHQDNFYFCLAPPQVLTMWLALDDVDEENGCLRYVPGSQLRGIRPHLRTTTLGFSQGIPDYTAADYAAEAPIVMSAGDLTVHHGNTIHRADANQSTMRHRRSFAMVFRGASCVRDATAFQRYLASSKAQREEFGLKT